MFRKFRDAVPLAAGFYVLRYRGGHETPCWMDPPRQGVGRIHSYPATYHNDRYDVEHDLGEYVWVNAYHIHGPDEWREMTYAEARDYHARLYRFARPTRRHPEGRAPALP